MQPASFSKTQQITSEISAECKASTRVSRRQVVDSSILKHAAHSSSAEQAANSTPQTPNGSLEVVAPRVVGVEPAPSAGSTATRVPTHTYPGNREGADQCARAERTPIYIYIYAVYEPGRAQRQLLFCSYVHQASREAPRTSSVLVTSRRHDRTLSFAFGRGLQVLSVMLTSSVRPLVRNTKSGTFCDVCSQDYVRGCRSHTRDIRDTATAGPTQLVNEQTP